MPTKKKPKLAAIKPLKSKKFGWKPDLPDARDIHYAPTIANPADLPKAVDLTKVFSTIPILNQGNLGSCTANALAVCNMAAQIKENKDNPFIPSRLFIYYNERLMEGTINEDSGAMIRTGIKSLLRQGAPTEAEWPYRVAKFRTKPPIAVYKDAANTQLLTYARINNRSLNDLMSVIASGLPFVFGFSVYESFESMDVERTGLYKPDPMDEQIIGGHAVAAFGYDQKEQTFTIRNSWGAAWGLGGYFKMRFADISNSNMCDDFWVLRTTE